MSSSSKRLCVLVALLSFIAFGLSAQSAAPAAGPGASIFSFELGALGGYNVNSNAPVCGRTFGFDLSVSDKLNVGYANVLAATTNTYNLVHLGYGIMPNLGVDLYVGRDAADVAAGLGVSYAIFQSKSAAGLSNALKARIEYLFDATNGLQYGDIVAAVVASVGL